MSAEATSPAAREVFDGAIIHAEDLWRTYQMGAEEIHALRGVSFPWLIAVRIRSRGNVRPPTLGCCPP